MNKYEYFQNSETINSDSSLEEAFHEGVIFAQKRVIDWLRSPEAQAMAGEIMDSMWSKDWADWLEAKIDAEDQET